MTATQTALPVAKSPQPSLHPMQSDPRLSRVAAQHEAKAKFLSSYRRAHCGRTGRLTRLQFPDASVVQHVGVACPFMPTWGSVFLVQKSQISIVLLTIGLGSCNADRDMPARTDEPFGFTELRELAAPIESITLANAPAAQEQLRRDGPQAAKLYLDALTRFESIYGEGVGPAKRKPDYLNCKTAFHAVAAQIGTVTLGGIDQNIDRLWASLKQCRRVAVRWAGPAEMATFGNDLKAMTDGSLLVLSYAATAAGSPYGPQFYSEFQALTDGR